ncbi:ribonuclease HII [Sulfurimonas sp. CVO]|uniref:Ribonuclease n=1 Tax=Sulfurimonas xiamenensis TaxID=2590021 RepID=A0AAJ4A2A2_9BACT|nr:MULTISPECIES: ribonuclease HII [Sulfurimonas]QFR42573.1 ribonuclease HII [Sulfurimonas xiamenensis]QHG91839.1 ribonuclease HII [Sulfurimonas sp. CVO]
MLCGIDEAGRGPIAGDLVIAGCILHSPIEELCDSKKLNEKKREILYETIIKNSAYHIVQFSSKEIDDHGISSCMKKALLEIINTLKCSEYLFDGNSTFGVNGLQTMVKADGKVPEVSAASILAKVTHDRNIIKDAKRYPLYEFEKHKGYGTARHIELIKKHGYCDIHRRSYKLKALMPTLF